MCRFLVIDKLGEDLDKTFKNGDNILDIGMVASVALQVLIITTVVRVFTDQALQVLDCLEYIHSRGYTHNDIKAANLLQGPASGSWFLVDFGLVVKFLKGEESAHKELKADPRKMHDGTIEYVSRDAHLGCTARRSDLECLALCLVHWTTGTLPWIHLIKGPPTKVQEAKETFFKGMPGTLGPLKLPAPVKEFLLYVAQLQFEQNPDYSKCRALFQGMAKVKKTVAGKTNTPKVSGKTKKVTAKDTPVAGSEEDDDDDVREKRPHPIKTTYRGGRQKAPRVVEVRKEDSFDEMSDVSVEEEEEYKPTPEAKKGTKAAVKKPAKTTVKKTSGKAAKSTQAEEIDSDGDMFAPSPQPSRFR